MNERISIMEFQGGPVYSWVEVASAWAKSEALDKNTFFSKVGSGGKITKFTLRKCGLSLLNAILWKGKYYFISHIAEDKMNLEVTTTQITPQMCIAKRNTVTKDDLNRPVQNLDTVATFPGCLIEKYLGYYQQQPQAINEIRFVLVTPKVIALETADIIQVGTDIFNVQIPHLLDEYKNEYEIALIKEV